MPKAEKIRQEGTQRDRATRRSATTVLDRAPSSAAAVQTAVDAPEKLTAPDVLSLQRSAGNRAVQRTLHGNTGAGNRGDVIQRRWNPPYLQQQLAQAAQLVAGDATEFTRYVLQATNPLQEGVGTFMDSAGPLPGAME